jgi:hypothetical protein
MYLDTFEGLGLTQDQLQSSPLHFYGVVLGKQVMGESNYRDSRMAAYRQEVRKPEEKFDGFELNHILW